MRSPEPGFIDQRLPAAATPAHPDLLGAASAHQPVADALAHGFADPAAFADRLATPEATAAFVARIRT